MGSWFSCNRHTFLAVTVAAVVISPNLVLPCHGPRLPSLTNRPLAQYRARSECTTRRRWMSAYNPEPLTMTVVRWRARAGGGERCTGREPTGTHLQGMVSIRRPHVCSQSQPPQSGRNMDETGSGQRIRGSQSVPTCAAGNGEWM